MSLATSGLNDAVNGIATGAAYISAHTASPGAAGDNEVTGGSYARQLTTWGVAASGSRVGSQVTIPIPAGTTVTHWGLWTAVSGGTYKGGWAVDTPAVFTGDGTLSHTPTLTATATN